MHGSYEPRASPAQDLIRLVRAGLGPWHPRAARQQRSGVGNTGVASRRWSLPIVAALERDDGHSPSSSPPIQTSRGHIPGTQRRSAAVSNGHERSIAPQVNGQMTLV
jgi:hypothetical protein